MLGTLRSSDSPVCHIHLTFVCPMKGRSIHSATAPGALRQEHSLLLVLETRGPRPFAIDVCTSTEMIAALLGFGDWKFGRVLPGVHYSTLAAARIDSNRPSSSRADVDIVSTPVVCIVSTALRSCCGWSSLEIRSLNVHGHRVPCTIRCDGSETRTSSPRFVKGWFVTDRPRVRL